MSNTNIKKQSNGATKQRAVYETLTTEEAEKLKKATLGHGRMAAAEDKTKLPRNTIMRAKEGLRILPINAKKIREFLKTLV
jgi:hypothetical protein